MHKTQQFRPLGAQTNKPFSPVACSALCWNYNRKNCSLVTHITKSSPPRGAQKKHKRKHFKRPQNTHCQVFLSSSIEDLRVNDLIHPGSRAQSRLAVEKTEFPLQRTTNYVFRLLKLALWGEIRKRISTQPNSPRSRAGEWCCCSPLADREVQFISIQFYLGGLIR